MPVRDLAPALLALGDLFTEASTLLYPDLPPPALNIRATEEGSFEVHLILSGAGGAWEQFVNLLSSEDATALANLQAVVLSSGSLGFGLFKLIQFLAGRKIKAQEPAPDPGQVRITLSDGTKIEAPASVLKLYRSKRIRRNAQASVSPLKRTGVERVDFRSGNEVTVSVEESDVEFFDVPEEDETELTDEEREMVVTIVSVSFSEGNKWRFSDGSLTFYAAIEDEGFLDRVHRGVEAFRNGDMLRCRMRLVQSLREGELHTEYRLAEVVEHIPSGEQLTMGDGAEAGNPEPA